MQRYYKLQKKDIYYDTHTKLLWQDNAQCTSLKLAWREAKDYCGRLELAGYKDWHLPKLAELRKLYNVYPKLQHKVPEEYWSATRYKTDSTKAWYVLFSDGSGSVRLKSSPNHVRCVRSH